MTIKNLDKFLEWLYDQYCREDIDFLDNEHIKLVKRHLKSLLTQQRTELLEEITDILDNIDTGMYVDDEWVSNSEELTELRKSLKKL